MPQVLVGILTLVGNFPRDGVAIKNTGACATLNSLILKNISVMSNQSISMKGVKEARTNSGEGLSPGRCPTEQQSRPGRHRTTVKGGRRRKWSQEVNRIVMECYYSSNPEVVGWDIERECI